MTRTGLEPTIYRTRDEHAIHYITEMVHLLAYEPSYVHHYIVNKKSLDIPKGNQNTYIEEEQTTQWLKEKVEKDKQRST